MAKAAPFLKTRLLPEDWDAFREVAGFLSVKESALARTFVIVGLQDENLARSPARPAGVLSPVTLYATRELLDALKAESKRQDRKVSALVRAYLLNGLDHFRAHGTLPTGGAQEDRKSEE